MERHFKVYYDTLDETRKHVLKLEYAMHREIDAYELQLKKLLSKASGLSVTEFYYERQSMHEEVASLQEEMNKFSIYLPRYTVIVNG